MSVKRPLIFGEVLFDCFPDGSRVLGGAPFNVAWHLQALGQEPLFMSRVGRDRNGQAIRRAMRAWGMDLAGLQEDADWPTGKVSVTLENGEPIYAIEHPAAFDRIQPPAGSANAGLVYHGSLALRDAASRQALAKVLEDNRVPVFVDVNLRAPWWGRENVLESVRRASWVKLNQEEREMLAPGLSPREVLDSFRLDGLILTQGAQGAQCLTRAGADVRVAPCGNGWVLDTVGAGDALASVMIHALLEGWEPVLALERAQAFASAICTQRGATVGEPAFYRQFLDRWRST
jgi:fructokinase